MQVLEVRNAELIRSLTEQAAEHGITDAAIVALIGGKPHIHAVMGVAGDRAIAGHLIKAQLGASFARAFVIPTEQPITLLADEGVVVEEFPDAGPPGHRRINDTRAPLA
jgi:predicted DNA-binding protein with PD1-like motif